MAGELEARIIARIEASTLLPESDKALLIDNARISYGHAQVMLPRLSIFNRREESRTWEGVPYWHYEDELFYISTRNKSNAGFFINKNREIVYSSRYYFTHLNAFSENVENFLKVASTVDVDDAINIGDDIIAIEKWFITYGHFKDEAYTLGSFQLSGTAENARALLDYPTDAGLDSPSFTHNVNYRKIEKLIFEGRSINAYTINAACLRLKGLHLLSNGFDGAGFHRFPVDVTQKIREKTGGAWRKGPIKRLFLTRSASYRDIGNKEEVATYLEQHGFTTINPEHISYEELVSLASEVETVAMFYGSALTNMIYFRPRTRIVVLKSESYMEETLGLWQKVISNYGLDVRVCNAIDNVIKLSTLEENL